MRLRSKRLAALLAMALLLAVAVLLLARYTMQASADTDTTTSELAPVLYVPNIMLDWRADGNIAPVTPHLPIPKHGLYDVITPVELDWQSGDWNGDAVTYDLYLEAWTDPPTTLIAKDLTESEYTFEAWGFTTYYWRVIARDEHGLESAGNVWCFTTKPGDIRMGLYFPQADGLNVEIDGYADTDYATISRINWDWGDGIVEDHFFPATHTYASAGGYTVTVSVYNNQGVVATDSLSLYVGPPLGVCDYIVGISKSECEGLVALYESAGGPQWNIEPGWITSRTPCDGVWEGVTCEEGHVTELDFRYKNLYGSVPAQFGNLVYLKSLYLWIDSATTLPEEIGNLKALTYLNFDGDSLAHLPGGFGGLESLFYLEICSAALQNLPPEIGNLSQLHEMKFCDGAMTSLPEELGNLDNVWKITLHNNPITTLPQSMGDMSGLQHIVMNHNALTTLPDSIGNCQLLTINLDYNALNALPESFGNLSRLSDLSLHANAITHLPDSFGNLSNLDRLILVDNNLTQLPDSFGNLNALTILHLGNNALTYLPDSFGNLSNLDNLNLNNNNLTQLPDSFGNLNRLIFLYVNDNALTDLPESFGNLSHLTRLQLSTNQLMTLPDSFGNLDAMQSLNIDANAFTSLPASVAGPDDLSYLYIQNNPGLSGPIPEFFAGMKGVYRFFFYNTNWCEPTTGPVADWLSTIFSVQGTGVPCEEANAIQMCRVDGG